VKKPIADVQAVSPERTRVARLLRPAPNNLNYSTLCILKAGLCIASLARYSRKL